MKRNFHLFLLAMISATVLIGCSKDTENETEETVDTTEQVAFDDVEVEDYTVLSYSELEVLAYQGDTEAQIMLGRMLEYGTEDVKQNFTEAISWYQMASDSGSVDGTDALGYFYLTGAGVDQNLDKAEELFKSAIDAGSVNAKVGLARVLLEKGDYEAVIDEADEMTEEKSEAKSEEKTSKKKDESDETEENELAQIVELLTVAQQAGDLDGGYYLGYIYEKGIGVTQDYKKAYDYYNRVVRSSSTALNDRDSINLSNIAIGIMYIKGYGVGVDTDAALEHFTVASDNSSPKASYYIGQMYEKGIGVDKDYEKAMEYYLKAADFDFAPALNQIGYLYYNGYGVDVDFASAVYYQKLAALQGYAIAQVNLGFLYENGYGVERNLETALSYYEMAANSGYEGATEAVVRVKAQINEEM
ncbi:tetratricopeptide repeat protein [Pseudobutyrivibrio xylanivorans]|uniref:TPR repeat n=1 Tax=Pseudobutyrivibrio xylanivorans DSM 14809 TaxID=1123012 RepID=A0A1M6CNZ0_PSEXY|nr:tetratricopeptide repeat protein [Pseudobutyrivibrio xylanivorans]SHI62726.1 hypothetical protein SAMN02745725_00773 [Pseudobutyrivibrio xylanivorans DSM 14809]